MDLYGISATAIAAAAKVSLRTALRWKQSGIPDRYRSLAALQLNGDLGEVAPEWRGWKLWNGVLWSPEGDSFTPGQVRSIPYRQELVRELQRQLEEPRQFQLL